MGERVGIGSSRLYTLLIERALARNVDSSRQTQLFKCRTCIRVDDRRVLGIFGIVVALKIGWGVDYELLPDESMLPSRFPSAL